MARYTLDTTTNQEAALTAIVAKRNAERAAQNPPLPALTNAEYVTSLWQSMLQSYVRETDDDTATTVREAWRNASAAQRNAARTALGL